MALDNNLILIIGISVFALSIIIAVVITLLKKSKDSKQKQPSIKSVQPISEDKPTFQIEQPTIPGLPELKDPLCFKR